MGKTAGVADGARSSQSLGGAAGAGTPWRARAVAETSFLKIFPYLVTKDHPIRNGPTEFNPAPHLDGGASEVEEPPRSAEN